MFILFSLNVACLKVLSCLGGLGRGETIIYCVLGEIKYYHILEALKDR
jgi:hypothetical protein